VRLAHQILFLYQDSVYAVKFFQRLNVHKILNVCGIKIVILVRIFLVVQ
jgi:hypothetical protein